MMTRKELVTELKRLRDVEGLRLNVKLNQKTEVLQAELDYIQSGEYFESFFYQDQEYKVKWDDGFFKFYMVDSDYFLLEASFQLGIQKMNYHIDTEILSKAELHPEEPELRSEGAVKPLSLQNEQSTMTTPQNPSLGFLGTSNDHLTKMFLNEVQLRLKNKVGRSSKRALLSRLV